MISLSVDSAGNLTSTAHVTLISPVIHCLSHLTMVISARVYFHIPRIKPINVNDTV
jgi:hypothetical protein